MVEFSHMHLSFLVTFIQQPGYCSSIPELTYYLLIKHNADITVRGLPWKNGLFYMWHRTDQILKEISPFLLHSRLPDTALDLNALQR